MEITINEAEPEGSINRYVMDTICTGEEALEIPAHWHMVGEARRAIIMALVLNRSESS